MEYIDFATDPLEEIKLSTITYIPPLGNHSANITFQVNISTIKRQVWLTLQYVLN